MVLLKLELRLQETKSGDFKKYLSFLKVNPDELQALVRTDDQGEQFFQKSRCIRTALIESIAVAYS